MRFLLAVSLAVAPLTPPGSVMTTVVLTPAAGTLAVGAADTVAGTVRRNGVPCAGCAIGYRLLDGDTGRASLVKLAGNRVLLRAKAAGPARLRGGYGGVADTAVYTVTAGPPGPAPGSASSGLSLSPDTLRLTVGQTDTLRVTGTTGTPSYGWDPAAADCVTAGFGATPAVTYWTGTAACRVRVWATDGAGAADTSWIIVTLYQPPDTIPADSTPPDTAPPPAGRAWHVSPTGTGAACTAAQPCSFATAIGDGSPARPGDTVRVHAGTYPGEFIATRAGTPSAPIIYRRLGRAIIDGPLFLEGADTWWWGLEHTYSLASGNQRDAIYGMAARLKLINCYIHDAWGNALGAQATAPDFELVGCVAVHNGLKGSGTHVPDVAHGFYTNSGPTGTITFRDFILTQTQGYGLHFYTQGNTLRDITVRGGIVYDNGQQDGCNATIGAGIPVINLTLEDNAFWEGVKGNGCVWLGRDATPNNGPMAVRRNVIYGGDPALRLYDWASGTLDSNVIVRGRGNLLERVGLSALSWARNAWYGTGTFVKPGATDTYASGVPANRVIVRPNPYEPGRANIAVYNWSRAASATAQVPGLGAYELRTPEAFAGAPVGTGTGPTVTLPLGGAVFRAFVVAPAGTLP
jgi:hypothetical protein